MAQRQRQHCPDEGGELLGETDHNYWNLTAEMRDFPKLTDDEESCSGEISVHLKSAHGLSNFKHLFF